MSTLATGLDEDKFWYIGSLFLRNYVIVYDNDSSTSDDGSILPVIGIAKADPQNVLYGI
jgi:hypothetical protein